MPKTTVVVVTWRGRDLVGACLDALAAQTAPHAVLVVDNGSTDGTAAVLAARSNGPVRQSPSGSAVDPPTVLRLPRNAGYAGALAAVLPRIRTPYVAWLNDDAEPEPSWLAELERTLDAEPAVAAAGSVLLRTDGEVQSAGVRLTPLGYGADLTTVTAEVFGFCGGAALLRTEALRAAGGVPKTFFCYYEDTDTAWRLRLAGHRIVTVPAARVRHRHGASSAIGSRRFHRWNERNRLLMLLRCAPLPVAARELARFAAITVALPVRRTPAGRSPNHRVSLRLTVLAEVIARLPMALAQRTAIGRRATVRRRTVWHGWSHQGATCR